MASNLREINILTCSSGVEEGIRDRREGAQEGDRKEDELVSNSVRLNIWFKGLSAAESGHHLLSSRWECHHRWCTDKNGPKTLKIYQKSV